jgi:hypothetical protein
MEVKEKSTFKEYPGYAIEWGYVTWTENKPKDQKVFSIRNRYDKEDGGYNVRLLPKCPGKILTY